MEWMAEKLEIMSKRLEEVEERMGLLSKVEGENDTMQKAMDREEMLKESIENKIREGIHDLEVKIGNIEKDRDLLELGVTESLVRAKRVEQGIRSLESEGLTLKAMVQALVAENSTEKEEHNNECSDNSETEPKLLYAEQNNCSQNKSSGSCKDRMTREVLIIGDSNVKRLETIITNVDKQYKDKVTLVSLPGGRIRDIKEMIGRILNSMKAEHIKVFFHVGVNDALRGSEEILKDLEGVVNELKKSNKKTDLTVCEIPVRTDKGNLVCSRLMGVNLSLKRKCRDGDSKVLDTTSILDGLKCSWTTDGVHYNRAAAKQVGSHICKDVVNFLA